MINPEPSEVALRGWASGRPPLGIPWSKKSRKNSSKGEPGGNCGISGPECSRPRSDFSVCAVEIFTTDGSNLAARSAKLSGAGRAPADPGTRAAATMIANGAITFAALRPTIFDIRYDTSVSSLAATADDGFGPVIWCVRGRQSRLREKRGASQP